MLEIVICIIIIIGFIFIIALSNKYQNQKPSHKYQNQKPYNICPVCGYYWINKYRGCTPPIDSRISEVETKLRKSMKKARKKYDADVAGRIF